MHIIPELADASSSKPSVATIGVFDGVHLGHQHLFAQLKREATRIGGDTIVLTFKNHPRTVLQPGFTLTYLTGLEDRIEVMKSSGIDRVVALTFTREVSQLTAKEFISQVRERLDLKTLIVGPDFALGKGREGNFQRLTEIGQELGYAVLQAEPFMVDGELVSSTAIREALKESSMPKVERFLGRPYSINGVVISGDRRGRTIGFPTANVDPTPYLALPGDGVYVTRAHLRGRALASVTNVGIRPTFDVGRRLVEVHILDFSEDIYGETLRVEFVRRLRPEVRFPNVHALVQQIKQDVEEARVVLRV